MRKYIDIIKQLNEIEFDQAHKTWDYVSHGSAVEVVYDFIELYAGMTDDYTVDPLEKFGPYGLRNLQNHTKKFYKKHNPDLRDGSYIKRVFGEVYDYIMDGEIGNVKP
jgi:hypothetical protein